MKRLALFLLLSSTAFAQLSSTGSITTNAANCNTTNVCIALTLFNTPAISTVGTAIQVSGTWTGTLSFEASADGTNFVAVPAQPVAGGATVTTTTANGTWVANIQALQQIRVRGSAAMTGAAVILLQASPASSGYPFPNYSVASLPLFLPIGTLAIATDSNAGSCTVGASTSLALCRWSGTVWAPVTAAGGGGLPAGLTFVSPTLTISSAGNGNGCVGLSGNTSGVATICAPAVAGTAVNGINISNTLVSAPGNGNNVSYGVTGATGTGINLSAAGLVDLVVGSVVRAEYTTTKVFQNIPICDFAVGDGCFTFLTKLVTVTGSTTTNFGFNAAKGQHFVTQAANNDMAGVCAGTTTTCAVVFTTNYTATPSCVVTPTTAGVTSFIITAQAISGFTVTYAPSATTNFNYVCIGNPN